MQLLLRNRNFLFMWLGQMVSSAGGWVNYVGLNVLLYEISGSGALLGVLFAARLIPALFFGALGGMLADRFDKRKLMIFCDICRAVLVLTFLFTKNVTFFIVMAVVLSMFERIYIACGGAIIPEVVLKEELTAANSIMRASTSFVGIIGPAIGGLLIGFWGYRIAFMIDSASFVFSVITLLLLRLQLQEAGSAKSKFSFLKEFGNSMAFVAGSVVLFLFALLRLLDAFGSGAFNTVMPVFSTKVPILYGTFYGWLLSFWGAGALLGASVTTRLRKRFRDVPLFCVCTLGMAVFMGGAFILPTPWPSLISMMIGGFSDGIANVLFITVIMEKVPKDILGKVYGTLTSLVYMVLGLGMLISGRCLDLVHYTVITNTGALFIIVCTVIGWIWFALSDKKLTEEKE